ncbi:MAG: hypothetical protein RLZZ546_1128 [Bacteroidota bacterium]
MTYTARLKVFCDDKNILSNLNYTFLNQSSNKSYGGKLDKNGCTKVYNCNKLDLIFIELILNNARLATIRIPALENGEFNQSSYKLKVTQGITKNVESNKVLVKVKNELEIAIDNLHATATYFGNNFLLHDAKLRQAYMNKIQEMCAGYTKEVKNRTISIKEAATEANALRNKILDATRAKNSSIGLAVSQKEKAVGKSLRELLEYYAMKIRDPNEFNRLKNISRAAIDNHIKNIMKNNSSYFDYLSENGKGRVYYSVLKGAGSSNAGFNSKIKWMKISGRVLVVISVAYAGYEIYNAENKEKEIYRQGVTIGGGIGGGAAGGAIAGSVCGPGAPICSGVGVLVGGIIGGYTAYKIMDAMDEEVEVFTQMTPW